VARLDDARGILAAARRATAFTGAGVSTASGVPDFRSPGGIWSRYRPVPFDEFLQSDDARRRYWAFKREAHASLAAATPNPAHTTLARLEAEGRLRGVITQNIDGLHQDAGSRRVIELHGTGRRVDCLSCGLSYPAAEIAALLDAGVAVPTCEACGGWLKPATISFGQALRPEVLAEAFTLAREADVLLVIGSSLVVYPAAGIPEATAAAGGTVILVNREPTPLDHLAAMVFREPIEEVVPALAPRYT
jgi:NAD-dependent deacetylase